MRQPLILVMFLLLCGSAYPQNISLEYIFQDTVLINPRPSLKFISSKSKKVYFFADDDYDGSLDLFYYNWNSDSTYKFPDPTITPSEFELLPNGDLIMITEGDIFLSKNFSETNEFTKDVQLTKSDEYEYSPMVRDNMLIFRRGRNYFLTTIDSVRKPEIQLTTDESDSISFQILAILDLTGLGNLSGSSKRILFARYDNSAKEKYIFPNFTTEDVSVDKQRRGVSKVMFLSYEIMDKKDSLKAIIDTVKFSDTTRYSVQYALFANDDRTVILDAETLDRHVRKLFKYDVVKKSMKEIYSESDTAWYERHGNSTISLSFDPSADQEIIFESEVSGYNSLYKIKLNGSGFTKIAGDNYTITESVYDSKNNKFYFIANKEKPSEWNVYETDFERSYVYRISDGGGECIDLHISGDGASLIYSQSFVISPLELYWVDLRTKIPKQITQTINPKFSDVKWKVPELISYENQEDGELISAYLYRPDNYSSKKRYPLICFAHGEGYLQNVTAGFSPYADNFMVDTYLTSQGFMILDVDFRGSMGYGKNFRTKTYRNLGYWEVSDFISGINYLDGLGLINRDKVGIYGGSYGGFISLMAAFQHPEFFKAAAALRPASDWRNYAKGNWWFTMGRLGDYQNEENKSYYEISSPITYAAQLQIPLLILHGMLDDNVYFQQSVLLVQKLIEEKKDFDIMFYPKEYHGFHLQSSWLDHYKRIYNFFEKNLK